MKPSTMGSHCVNTEGISADTNFYPLDGIGTATTDPAQDFTARAKTVIIDRIIVNAVGVPSPESLKVMDVEETGVLFPIEIGNVPSGTPIAVGYEHEGNLCMQIDEDALDLLIFFRIMYRAQ